MSSADKTTKGPVRVPAMLGKWIMWFLGCAYLDGEFKAISQLRGRAKKERLHALLFEFVCKPLSEHPIRNWWKTRPGQKPTALSKCGDMSPEEFLSFLSPARLDNFLAGKRATIKHSYNHFVSLRPKEQPDDTKPQVPMPGPSAAPALSVGSTARVDQTAEGSDSDGEDYILLIDDGNDGEEALEDVKEGVGAGEAGDGASSGNLADDFLVVELPKLCTTYSRPSLCLLQAWVILADILRTSRGKNGTREVNHSMAFVEEARAIKDSMSPVRAITGKDKDLSKLPPVRPSSGKAVGGVHKPRKARAPSATATFTRLADAAIASMRARLPMSPMLPFPQLLFADTGDSPPSSPRRKRPLDRESGGPEAPPAKAAFRQPRAQEAATPR